MSKGRANIPIWNLVVPDGSTPGERSHEIRSACDARVVAEGLQPLERVELSGSIPDVELELYVRNVFSRGFAPFVEFYLDKPDVDAQRFYIRRADACLFIICEEKLYAVT